MAKYEPKVMDIAQKIEDDRSRQWIEIALESVLGLLNRLDQQ